MGGGEALGETSLESELSGTGRVLTRDGKKECGDA